MGVCIDKLPHSCGTKTGLQVFADEETGKINGYCFRCNTFVANPPGYEGKTVDDVEIPEAKSEEEIREEMEEVSSFPTVSVPSRKLRGDSLEGFGIKVALSEEDGRTPTRMYFPQRKKGVLTGYYVKTLSSDKKLTWSIGDVKGAEPFGWQEAKRSGAYRLIITEGMEDAVAVRQIMARHGKEEYMPAVISLPNGVNSVDSSLTQIVEEASKTFREIVFCFDDDEAGKEAVSKAALIFPEALSVTLPEKDANDCILKGAQAAAHKALSFNAEKPKNTRIVSIDETFEAAAKPAEWGELSWPWEGLQQLTRGIRLGETYYIGAAPKMGKSEIVNALAEHFISQDEVKVFMAKPEEANVKTTKLLAGKAVGKVFHDPKVEFDLESFREASKKLSGKAFYVNLYQHVDWKTLRGDIIHAAKNEGVKAVFIDPITNLTNGMESGEANVKLQEIAQEASALALDLKVVIFIFCHLKSPNSILSDEKRQKHYNEGKYTGFSGPHEKGGEVISSQFAGSRAMMRSCNYMLALEGNKDEELPPEIRNLRWLRLLEDREFGEVGSVQLFWDKNTTLFKEV